MIEAAIAGSIIGYSLVGGIVAAFIGGPEDEELGLLAIFWPLLVVGAPAILSYRVASRFRKPPSPLT